MSDVGLMREFKHSVATQCRHALSNNDMGVFGYYLKHQSITKEDCYGFLYEACHLGNNDAINLLINLGIDVSHRENMAIATAVRSDRVNVLETIKLLHRHGASLEVAKGISSVEIEEEILKYEVAYLANLDCLAIESVLKDIVYTKKYECIKV